MLLGQAEKKPPTLKSIEVSTLLATLIAYFFVRFFVGNYALPIIGAFVLLLLPSFRWRLLRTSALPYFLLPLCLLVVAVADSAIQGDKGIAIYFSFALIALWCKAVGGVSLSCRKHENMRRLALSYVVLAFPFLIFPQLQDLSTHVLSQGEAAAQQYMTGEDTHGLVAFFYHSNEFGLVTLGLSVAFLASSRAAGRLRFFSVDSLLYLVLVGYILIAKSTTALLGVVFTIAMMSGVRRQAEWGALVLFTVQAVTQLFFAEDIAALLKSGSFWWRYEMAAKISENAGLIDYSLGNFSTLPNWPHSFLMDICLCFGKLVCLLVVLPQLIYSFPRKGIGERAWNAFFFSIVSTMPIGAGMSSSILAVAFGFAEASRKNKAGKLPRREQIGVLASARGCSGAKQKA